MDGNPGPHPDEVKPFLTTVGASSTVVLAPRRTNASDSVNCQKRACKGVRTKASSGHKHSSHCFIIFDRTHRRRFLVTTGANVSITPLHPTKINTPMEIFHSNPQTAAAYKSSDRAPWHLKLLKIPMDLLVADVSAPIIWVCVCCEQTWEGCSGANCENWPIVEKFSVFFDSFIFI